MLIAEFLINGEQYDFFLFKEEDAPIATKRFRDLVEANVYDQWIVEFTVEDGVTKIGPQREFVPFSDRPLTRVDFNTKPHRYGFLSFVGADPYHVSDRLVIMLDSEEASDYDGVCSPIGMVATNHHVKIQSIEKGHIIEKITINDYPEEEILARKPAFI
ncbi:hypothetical protein [Flammeovirga sp. SJP92]|uniref:hypothetical protein n=1 Tax=Flammeovirga sp. SJP92 TaxID=1775430 RepID=UPI000787ABCD|nr:hypothetical protein [Flammeovirga sp. SJP92]KXX72261.1 hypothetical protein AVL50_01275 [Flammeovirga sp. SJP92]